MENILFRTIIIMFLVFFMIGFILLMVILINYDSEMDRLHEDEMKRLREHGLYTPPVQED